MGSTTQVSPKRGCCQMIDSRERTNRTNFTYYRQSERLKAKPTTAVTKQFLTLFNIFSRKIFVIFFQIYIVTNWIIGALDAHY